MMLQANEPIVVCEHPELPPTNLSYVGIGCAACAIWMDAQAKRESGGAEAVQWLWRCGCGRFVTSSELAALLLKNPDLLEKGLTGDYVRDISPVADQSRPMYGEHIRDPRGDYPGIRAVAELMEVLA